MSGELRLTGRDRRLHSVLMLMRDIIPGNDQVSSLVL